MNLILLLIITKFLTQVLFTQFERSRERAKGKGYLRLHFGFNLLVFLFTDLHPAAFIIEGHVVNEIPVGQDAYRKAMQQVFAAYYLNLLPFLIGNDLEIPFLIWVFPVLGIINGLHAAKIQSAAGKPGII
ncbi:MAG: hypothetical protein JWO09_1135 [Bacteroidetes bacterium]|nr:hypothetical protein [Bacteroidota bacterium]